MALKPITRPRTQWDMNRIVTIDIESYEWTNPVALGMYYGARDNYSKFKGEDCIENFVDEMMRSKWRNHRFVAHNGGNYDFIPIIERLVDVRDEYDLEINIITRGSNDSPFFIQIQDKHGKPRYLQDSFALMPRTLKALSKSFTDDFQKIDFDVSKIDKLSHMETEVINEMLQYLERDCETLYKILDNFTDIVYDLSNGSCPCQLTMGSTTMGVYRTEFMPNISIENSFNPEANQNPEEMFRNSYYGGRTEVYNMHGGFDLTGSHNPYGEGLYHYDVNSLYPYCYTHKPIPIGDVTHTGKRFPIDNTDLGGVLKINGYIPNEACNGIPVLPTRIRSDEYNQERVVFPSGNIEGWYMAKEVRYAMEVGALENVEILDSYCSEYGKPFEDYGKTLYDMKQNIDKHEKPGRYNIVKLLLNSFYGKFGMDRNHNSVVIGEVTKEFQEGKEMITDELANKGVMMEETESNAKYIIPRIASSITAQARIQMHKWFMDVYERGGKVWYCDTDSIVTDVKLPEGNDLGEMDLEGELKEGVFLAPKVYGEKYHNGEEMVKVKGMKFDNEENEMTYDIMKQAYVNNDPSLVSSEWETVEGFKSGLKSGSESWFNVKQQERSLRQFDQKRNHGDSGSVPITL